MYICIYVYIHTFLTNDLSLKSLISTFLFKKSECPPGGEILKPILLKIIKISKNQKICVENNIIAL